MFKIGDSVIIKRGIEESRIINDGFSTDEGLQFPTVYSVVGRIGNDTGLLEPPEYIIRSSKSVSMALEAELMLASEYHG